MKKFWNCVMIRRVSGRWKIIRELIFKMFFDPSYRKMWGVMSNLGTSVKSCWGVILLVYKTYLVLALRSISIDLSKPLLRKTTGRKSVVVAVRHFTGWPTVLDLKSQRSDVAIRLLSQKIFGSFGCSKVIKRDRDSSITAFARWTSLKEKRD